MGGRYEYKVVPAPKRGVKARGLKGTDDRFAHAIEEEMNRLGAAGWEFQRSDTLPCEERAGLTGKTTTFQSVLVFRRELSVAARMEDEDQPEPPRALAPPVKEEGDEAESAIAPEPEAEAENDTPRDPRRRELAAE